MDSSETTIYHAVVIGSVLVGGIFIFFTLIIFRAQRRYFKMQQARLLAEISLLEKERARIARDLHDELGPTLTVTGIQLWQVIRDPQQRDNLLSLAQQNIQKTNQRLGEIARNLIPASLTAKGLDYALREFLGQFETLGMIIIHYNYEVEAGIHPDIALQLFRMVQEIVNNTIKHSEASTITIQLKERKKKLYLLCCDNGKGINNTTLSHANSGSGLNNLRNRAVLLGGKMQVKADNGTEYFFELPLNHPENDHSNPAYHRR